MTEGILPCPACGMKYNEKAPMLYVESADCEDDGCFIVCKNCGARGPVSYVEDDPTSAEIEKSEAAAIAAWNTLPRALRRTHEPPKQPDQFYWAKGTNLMVFVVHVINVNGTLLAKIPGSNEACPLSDFVEWSDRPLVYPLEES